LSETDDTVRGAVRLIVARCEVRYAGRLTAVLPESTRLLILKSDGSVLIHNSTDPKPEPTEGDLGDAGKKALAEERQAPTSSPPAPMRYWSRSVRLTTACPASGRRESG